MSDLEDTPFHAVDQQGLQEFGVRVLYHRGYDEHYLRLDGNDDLTWYEITPYSTSLTEVPDKVHDMLEEQYQW